MTKAEGVLPGGQPMHEMWLRLRVGRSATIVAAVAATDAVSGTPAPCWPRGLGSGLPFLGETGDLTPIPQARVAQVLAILSESRVSMTSLRLLPDGTPCHPLMLPYSCSLQPFLAAASPT